uniref:Beta/alpha-defensin C-terminal domain-containing protein n=1 Tax=Equus asinus TaxID=9793 RepID=A0A8C4N6R8_EQUAS
MKGWRERQNVRLGPEGTIHYIILKTTFFINFVYTYIPTIRAVAVKEGRRSENELGSCIRSKGICLPIRCLPGMRDIGTCGLRRTKCCKRK